MLRPSKKRNRLAEAITIVIELYDKKILSSMDFSNYLACKQSHAYLPYGRKETH